MRLEIKILSVVAVAIMSLGTDMAAAKYPERPIEVIVPWPPGDLEDVIARLISDQLQEDYGVPSAVVNMPGGSGVIGANHVAQAAADGYTIGMLTGNILTAHIINGRTPFDRETFDPVGIAISYPMGLFARTDLPFEDMAGLAAYAQDNPVSLGHFGFNGPPTRQTILAAKKLGFEFAGNAAYNETNCTLLSSGDADVIVSTVQLVRPCLDSGDARGIAAYTRDRIAILPDLATLEEQVPGVAAPAWAGVFVRSDTPQEVRDALAASCQTVMNSEKVAEIAANTGAVLSWTGGEDADVFVDEQYERVEQLFAQ